MIIIIKKSIFTARRSKAELGTYSIIDHVSSQGNSSRDERTSGEQETASGNA